MVIASSVLRQCLEKSELPGVIKGYIILSIMQIYCNKTLHIYD